MVARLPHLALIERLGLAHPIIQAPMGGGFTPPDFVAAVCNAGALGSLGSPYQTPEQITADAARVRSQTRGPFNINLFAGGHATHSAIDAAAMVAIVAQAHSILNIPPPRAPAPTADPFPEQLAAVLQIKPAVFSFTFGIPRPEAMHQLRAANIYTIGTATTVAEARQLAAAGVDAIAAQGAEAGAHRGTFIGGFEEAMVPTMTLVREIVAATDVPVIAAGGLMDGNDIAAALAAGAAAAQLGTAFLCCPEAGTPAAHKAALRAARTDTTEITRAYSGRPARGLRTAFMDMVAGHEAHILPFPLQNNLTRPMRAAASAAGDARFLSLWAGQGVTRCRTLPVAELVRVLAEELAAAQRRAS